MTDIEKAYLAGVFDSRCYISLGKSGTSTRLELELCRALPVLTQVRKIIGAGGIQRLRSGYRYRLRGRRVKMVLAQVAEMLHSEIRYEV